MQDALINRWLQTLPRIPIPCTVIITTANNLSFLQSPPKKTKKEVWLSFLKPVRQCVHFLFLFLWWINKFAETTLRIMLLNNADRQTEETNWEKLYVPVGVCVGGEEHARAASSVVGQGLNYYCSWKGSMQFPVQGRQTVSLTSPPTPTIDR